MSSKNTGMDWMGWPGNEEKTETTHRDTGICWTGHSDGETTTPPKLSVFTVYSCVRRQDDYITLDKKEVLANLGGGSLHRGAEFRL